MSTLAIASILMVLLLVLLAGGVWIAVALAAFLAGPLSSILAQSVEGKQGEFVGLDNFFAYFGSPALANSLWNSVWTSLTVTAIVLPAAV